MWHALKYCALWKIEKIQNCSQIDYKKYHFNYLHIQCIFNNKWVCVTRKKSGGVTKILKLCKGRKKPSPEHRIHCRWEKIQVSSCCDRIQKAWHKNIWKHDKIQNLTDQTGTKMCAAWSQKSIKKSHHPFCLKNIHTKICHGSHLQNPCNWG